MSGRKIFEDLFWLIFIVSHAICLYIAADNNMYGLMAPSIMSLILAIVLLAKK